MMRPMRTTVTLTPESDALVRKLMRERGLSFKDAINIAIIEGLAPTRDRSDFSTPTFDLGEARVPIEHALRLAADLEDEELLRKITLGK